MTEPTYTAEIVCPGCSATVPPGGDRCPECGGVLGPAKKDGGRAPERSDGRPPARQEAGDKAAFPLQERRWLVISLMVFAALFLGFPFLWRSRAFSRGEKIFWTIAVLIETVVLFWLFYVAMAWAINNIRESLH